MGGSSIGGVVNASNTRTHARILTYLLYATSKSSSASSSSSTNFHQVTLQMVPKKGGLGEPAWSVVFRAAVVVAEIFSSRSGACACRGGGRFAFAASEGGSFSAWLAIDDEQLGISVRHGGSAA